MSQVPLRAFFVLAAQSNRSRAQVAFGGHNGPTSSKPIRPCARPLSEKRRLARRGFADKGSDQPPDRSRGVRIPLSRTNMLESRLHRIKRRHSNPGTNAVSMGGQASAVSRTMPRVRAFAADQRASRRDSNTLPPVVLNEMVGALKSLSGAPRPISPLPCSTHSCRRSAISPLAPALP